MIETVSGPRDGSIGAASLGARREAPAPREAPSVRSDERTLATQGDLLNSIKFQRRYRETLKDGKFANMQREKSGGLSTASREKYNTKTVNSNTSSSVTKSRLYPDFGIPREKPGTNDTRNFFRAARPSSPKGRRSMQPSFF